jgi:hypothetical protein
MRLYKRHFFRLAIVAIAISVPAYSQQIQRTPFDVTGYQIDAQLQPAENKLVATADVTFVPLEDTRSVSFELNGSLKIDSITRLGIAAGPGPLVGPAPPKARSAATPVAPAGSGTITFVQDQVGVSDLGPSVRIDLGDTVTKGTPIKLRFKYNGVLNTASGGPLLTKRLAYIGDDQGYLNSL